MRLRLNREQIKKASDTSSKVVSAGVLAVAFFLMNLNIDGLYVLVIVGALVFVGMSILVYPTLKEQAESKRKSSKKE